MANLKLLLEAIRKHEAPKGYGQIYGGAKGVSKSVDVSKLTLNEVLSLQSRMLAAGSASTASGGYQFIRKTLLATISQMGLKGSEVWSPELQDRMAIHLMMGRGLGKYLDGRMSREDFANNLAKEWASLPVVTRIQGQKRMVDPGESYYAGDGLNKSFHKPSDILKLLEALKEPVGGVLPLPSPTPPEPLPIKPRGFLMALVELIATFFKRKS